MPFQLVALSLLGHHGPILCKSHTEKGSETGRDKNASGFPEISLPRTAFPCFAGWRHVDPVRDGIGAYSYGSVVNAVNETGTLSAITQPGADKPRRAGREPAPKIRRPA